MLELFFKIPAKFAFGQYQEFTFEKSSPGLVKARALSTSGTFNAFNLLRRTKGGINAKGETGAAVIPDETLRMDCDAWDALLEDESLCTPITSLADVYSAHH